MKTAVSMLFKADFSLALSANGEFSPVRKTDADGANKTRGALFFRSIFKVFEKLLNVRFIVSVYAAVACGINAGRTAEKINRKTAVIGDTRHTAFTAAAFGFENGIFLKGFPRFRNICECYSGHFCRENLNAERRENALHLRPLFHIMRSNDEFHYSSSSL